MARSDIFGRIYDELVWGAGESASGPGSAPSIAHPYVEFVLDLVTREQVRSVVDIGHGDWAMWPEEAFLGVDYRGFDVAAGLSERVASRYGAPHRTFVSRDAVTDDLPPADLALCKDVLQHLPDRDVVTILGRLRAYQLVVVCHDVHAPAASLGEVAYRIRRPLAIRRRFRALSRGSNPFRIEPWRQPLNSDTEPGGWRPLDLVSKPWNLESLGFRLITSFDFVGWPGPWTGICKRLWLLEPIAIGLEDGQERAEG